MVQTKLKNDSTCTYTLACHDNCYQIPKITQEVSKEALNFHIN